MTEADFWADKQAREYSHWLYITELERAREEQKTDYNLVSILNPKFTIDGNQWCVLYGENLQDGVYGFGSSPHLAVLDFNKNFNEKLTEKGPY